MDILALFNLGAVLFATVGGFSSILSTYVNPTFRSVNRMSVFIAFISLITVGLILQYIRSRKFQLGVAILLVSLALFDQVSIGTLRNFSKNFSNFESLSSYAVLIETAAGPDAKIFTLPVGQYPEGSDKDMLRVALLTKNISWSTGAEKWRASNYWQHKTSQLETKQFLAEIIKQGFTGILVDTKKIDKNKLASIENELSTSALEDTEKQYRFYDVQNYARTNNISYNPTKLFYYISGNCVYNGLSSFYCVKAGQVQIENMFDKEVSKTLYITIERPNGNREGISRSLSIPVGTSNYVFGKSATENVFPVPYDIPSWPLNMGYPNFIVRSVEIH